MYGNCLTFAVYDFIKNGGELYISFHKKCRFPHFTVQRDDKVYDLEIVIMILKELWYYGEIRARSVGSFNRSTYKRFLLAKRHITTIKVDS